MSTQTKHEYILLIHSNEWYNDVSLEELQKAIDQFKTWYDRLAADGKVKSGQALGREGATVSGKNARILSDGPFAESKEAIGGFLIIEAGSLEEAIAVAKTNPGLARGMTLEVRPVAEDCPLNARVRQLLREDQLATA